jgi:antibiotic biosynthesis monooxygenase (ABM) superfamily enzyme
VSATAVTVLVRPADPAGLDAWLADLADSARSADGFVESTTSVHADARLDLAIAVTFRDESLLDAWLDGSDRAGVLRAGSTRGFHRAATDLVLIDGEPTPPGVAVFRHFVTAGRTDEFIGAQRDLTAASAKFTGYEGTVVFPPGRSGEWTSLIRFRTQRLLAAWLRSTEREDALSPLRSTLDEDFSTFTQTTPFGTTVRVEDGQAKLTPGWKSAMLVLLVLYPTVMLLSRFFGPILEGMGAGPWLTIWLSQVLSVSLLQWVLMPFAVRWMRRWLDPVDGAGLGVTLRGVAIVVAGYVVTLAIFATVTWLQYWDYH